MNFDCCVLGLGYIGLPTAALLAKSGHKVVGVDIDSNVLETINSGSIHIVEPDLEALVSDVVASGLLLAQSEPTFADYFIITVPTPFKDNSNRQSSVPEPCTDYIFNAALSLAPFLRQGNTVILESTAPVGTTDKLASFLCRHTSLSISDFNVAYCPERVLPGNILNELVTNDRVIGGINSSSSLAADSFYSTFCRGTLMTTSAATAELVKLTENSFVMLILPSQMNFLLYVIILTLMSVS